MAKKLLNRTAVVTGASRLTGIGAAICRELAKEGADIFFTYWSNYDEELELGKREEPAQLLKEIKGYGVRCASLELDLTRPDACERLLNEAETAIGQPAILVNNACYSVNDNIETINSESLDKHYEINVRATTLLTAAFIKRFKGKSGGRIINLTTGWSRGPMPDEISYVLTKSAIETLTFTLSTSIARKGITINSINPGPTDTGWMTEEIQEHLLPLFPQGRMGYPKDAANLAAFLASDEAEWITGQVIHSEGGFNNWL